MAGMGPAPKAADQRRRRNADVVETTSLPTRREGAAPDWPLGEPDPAEAAVWSEIWTRPQAWAWEKLSLQRVVARYVRMLVAAEQSQATAILAEVRQMEDRLGLNPLSMLRLRWQVGDGEDPPATGDPAGRKADPRKRLAAVPDAS